MSSLRPLRVIGPGLLAACAGIAVALTPAGSPLAGTQFAFLLAGGVLVTAAAYRNPLRSRLGWRSLLGLGEVAVGVAVPIGVLGTGMANGATVAYGLVAGIAAAGLAAVIGTQLLAYND